MCVCVCCCDVVCMYLFFFFFQAEDGIRDDLVTGVQTCALPICPGGDREVDRVEASPRIRRWKTDDDHYGSSEERRVGKECRSRWAPGHYKKKKEKEGGEGVG